VFTIVIVALFLIGLFFVHFYVPRFITEIRNPIIRLVRGNPSKVKRPTFTEREAEGRYFRFESFDKVQLSSFLSYSKLDTTKGTVILLHGIRSYKEHFIGLSEKLSRLGYNSVALDSRAHGESQGQHCTFGVKEKKDISKLIDALEAKEGITHNIGVWGQSLGGAIGLQALGSDKRIKFGIIESTFSDFQAITNDYFNYHAGFNIRMLTNYLVGRAGTIAGFDPEDARPMKYCKNIEQPILIVHGNKDIRISIDYARANFANLASEEKEFLEMESANHLNVWKIGGDRYFEKVVAFLHESTVGSRE